MELPILKSERLLIRPIAEADVDPLIKIIRSPSVSPWWTFEGEAPPPPEDITQDGAAFAIEVGGELAGWLGWEEVDETGYRWVSLDIVLAEGFQDRGLGPEALRTAIDWFVEARGHHRFTIDPAVANERAIRAYESVGFKPVGVMRRYEQLPDGDWRDSLLMDLLAEELEPGKQRRQRSA